MASSNIHIGKYIFVLSLLLAGAVSELVKLGSFFPCAHELQGDVYLVNERHIQIQNFKYDGKGPGAWFHGMKRGASIITSEANFVTIPFPNCTCDRLEVGKAYSGQTVDVHLPVKISEMATFGILCYQYCHNFGHVVIPEPDALAKLPLAPVPADYEVKKECTKPEYPSCGDKVNGNNIQKPC